MPDCVQIPGITCLVLDAALSPLQIQTQFGIFSTCAVSDSLLQVGFF
jgi:hypothetical protein